MSISKTKIFVIGMGCLIALSMTINSLYGASVKLKQAIILPQYRELYISQLDEKEVVFRYITDRYDTRRLTSVTFDGIDEVFEVRNQSQHRSMGFSFNPVAKDNPYDDGRGRFYTIKYGYTTLSLSDKLQGTVGDKGHISLSHGMLHFDDGSAIETNLGNILIVKDRDKTSSPRSDGAHGSSLDYTRTYLTDVDLMIHDIDLTSYEAFKEDVSLEIIIDGHKVYGSDDILTLDQPIKVERSIELHFWSIEEDNDGQWRFDFICPEMDYTKDGQEGKIYMTHVFHHEHLNVKQVEAVVDHWRDLQ